MLISLLALATPLALATDVVVHVSEPLAPHHLAFLAAHGVQVELTGAEPVDPEALEAEYEARERALEAREAALEAQEEALEQATEAREAALEAQEEALEEASEAREAAAAAQAEAVVETRRELREERHPVRLEGYLLAMPGDVTGGGAITFDGRRPGFLELDVRSQATGDWVGRATAGLDVFNRWERFDLTLGLVLAGAGDWHDMAIYPNLGAGLHAGVQGHLGRLHLGYRAYMPVSDNAPSRGLSEHQTRVGFDLTESFQLYGQAVVINPDVEGPERVGAYGLGVLLRL